MDWNEFLERYLTNHEEFHLKYHNYKIDLLYSCNGEKFAYYISHYNDNDNLFQRIKNRNRYLEFREFVSPYDLIEKFAINGKTLKDIWDELDW